MMRVMLLVAAIVLLLLGGYLFVTCVTNLVLGHAHNFVAPPHQVVRDGLLGLAEVCVAGILFYALYRRSRAAPRTR